MKRVPVLGTFRSMHCFPEGVCVTSGSVIVKKKIVCFHFSCFHSERMTCQDCLLHPWLRSDDSCLSSTRSPFGSPLGTRRAHSPTEKLIGDTAPVKKYKFADLNLLNLEGRLNTQLEDCTNKNRSSAACSSITKLA